MEGLPLGYLHNAVEELNSGLPRTNPDSSRVEDLNHGPPDFKNQRPKPLDHAACADFWQIYLTNSFHIAMRLSDHRRRHNVVRTPVTRVLRRWGILQDILVLSTGLVMWISHRKQIRKLTFRALALSSERGDSSSSELRLLQRKQLHSIFTISKPTTFVYRQRKILSLMAISISHWVLTLLLTDTWSYSSLIADTRSKRLLRNPHITWISCATLVQRMHFFSSQANCISCSLRLKPSGIPSDEQKGRSLNNDNSLNERVNDSNASNNDIPSDVTHNASNSTVTRKRSLRKTKPANIQLDHSSVIHLSNSYLYPVSLTNTTLLSKIEGTTPSPIPQRQRTSS